ncbi:MAG: YchJ family metal-binding protein, partial [Chlamydiales bacterium]
MKCPCHSGKSYESCCAPYHEGEICPNALLLMRSRYSAYALGNADYILKTTHPQHTDNQIPTKQRIQQIEAFSQQTRFEGLAILNFEAGEPFS